MRRISTLFIFLFLFVISAYAGTDVKTTPSTSSQVAPDFSLADQDGKLWKLSDVLKDYKGVVLAFYAKDDTKL
jgi:cytochrome oxidase Cu insertion factor (SCO1/SenC/PrrC family)